jgi:hypothetical protein
MDGERESERERERVREREREKERKREKERETNVWATGADTCCRRSLCGCRGLQLEE